MKRTTIRELSGTVSDVLIIGGGITGTCAARDAALRGLSTVLLEKDDFAAGTSSRSTKLLHGGLRYLEKFEFGLVREACRERELMLKLAPHLSNPRPFIYLLYDGYTMVTKWLPATLLMLHAGLTTYDLSSGNPRERRHKMLNKRRLLELEPHLNPQGLKGGGYYYDFLTDDARFTIDTIKGAVEAGALAANHTRVTGFVLENGRIAGVEARDMITGEEGVIRAKQVINAGGPWTDEVRLLEEGVRDQFLSPSKGIHIVLRKKDFPLNHAIFLRSPRDGRTVWPIPALDSELVYVGTTDTFYDGSLDHVVATEEDIAYLLEAANFAIPESKVGFDHIIGTWAGLRPLVKPPQAASASAVSREHEIFVSPRGLLNIAGGKLTTARVMGLQVIDRAVKLLEQEFGMRGICASNSNEIPLSGGSPESIERARQLAHQVDLPQPVEERLLSLYGGNFEHIAQIILSDPAALHSMGGHHIIAAEVRYAVLEEMALSVTDFFTRRASLFYWLEDGGLDIAPAVGSEMASLLGWDASELATQIDNYRAWVSANRFTPVRA